MNPLFNPEGIGGANPYTLSKRTTAFKYFRSERCDVSTNFVSFMKKQEKEVTKELSCPAPTVDDVKEEKDGFIGFLEGVGNGAKKIGKGLLDFLLLADVNTLADKNASGLDKGIALASFNPIGKVLKIPKRLIKLLIVTWISWLRRVM